MNRGRKGRRSTNTTKRDWACAVETSLPLVTSNARAWAVLFFLYSMTPISIRFLFDRGSPSNTHNSTRTRSGRRNLHIAPTEQPGFALPARYTQKICLYRRQTHQKSTELGVVLFVWCVANDFGVCSCLVVCVVPVVCTCLWLL